MATIKHIEQGCNDKYDLYIFRVNTFKYDCALLLYGGVNNDIPWSWQ